MRLVFALRESSRAGVYQPGGVENRVEGVGNVLNDAAVCGAAVHLIRAEPLCLFLFAKFRAEGMEVIAGVGNIPRDNAAGIDELPVCALQSAGVGRLRRAGQNGVPRRVCIRQRRVILHGRLGEAHQSVHSTVQLSVHRGIDFLGLPLRVILGVSLAADPLEDFLCRRALASAVGLAQHDQRNDLLVMLLCLRRFVQPHELLHPAALMHLLADSVPEILTKELLCSLVEDDVPLDVLRHQLLEDGHALLRVCVALLHLLRREIRRNIVRGVSFKASRIVLQCLLHLCAGGVFNRIDRITIGISLDYETCQCEVPACLSHCLLDRHTLASPVSRFHK